MLCFIYAGNISLSLRNVLLSQLNKAHDRVAITILKSIFVDFSYCYLYINKIMQLGHLKIILSSAKMGVKIEIKSQFSHMLSKLLT